MTRQGCKEWEEALGNEALSKCLTFTTVYMFPHNTLTLSSKQHYLSLRHNGYIHRCKCRIQSCINYDDLGCVYHKRLAIFVYLIGLEKIGIFFLNEEMYICEKSCS